MKAVIVFLIVVAVSAVRCADNDFYDGPPVKNCPPGEHSVLYCPPMAEPDCNDPTVHLPEIQGPCDIPDCFCDTPTVRDLSTGKCVKKSKCPPKQ